MSAAPPVLALVGPTASGKSAVALALAQQFALEIISMDSAQVYRGMDVGTAKPSAAERAFVPHHLVDIREPQHSYSAAAFAEDAKRLIAEIQARGRIPLLCGGTMLYLRALTHGLDPLPSADAALRAQLQAQAQARGWPALHAELALLDPISAARLAPNDGQRIGRALEVWRATGRTLSSYQRLHAAALPDASKNIADSAYPISENCIISLEPQDRAWLHQRIAERFDAMLAAGLLDEVRALRQRSALHAELSSMRCVGYRQAWAWLDAAERGGNPALGELRERGVFATRQLAKRQLTWLRAMPERTVFAAEAPNVAQQVLAYVRAIAASL